MKLPNVIISSACVIFVSFCLLFCLLGCTEKVEVEQVTLEQQR